MLSEREIWKDLVKLKKDLKGNAAILKQQVVLDDDSDIDDTDDEDANANDKSNVDTDENYTLTREDRANVKNLLISEDDDIIANILYSTYPGIRVVNKVKQWKHGRLSTEETVYLEKKE